MSVHNHLVMIETHGLQDDCPRCAEIADDPVVALDDKNLAALAKRTLAWMGDREFPRSKNERTAMRGLEHLTTRARQLARAVPEWPS